MEGKKISFGFMKTKKVEKPVVEEKKEYIESIEEKALKIVGGEEIKEAALFVIPMKPNTLVTAERLKQIAEEVENAVNAPEPEGKKSSPEPQGVLENETIDQMAVRELVQEAKKEVKTKTMALTVPVPAKPVLSGQKESTLEDYEEVPIQEFGMAMLRGMGWKPGNEGVDEESGRRRRVSYGQLELLWKLLNSHREVAVGHNKSSQDREHSKRVWKKIAAALNSHGSGDGAAKDWKGWSNYWVDYKAKLKRKAATLRNSMDTTDGVPPDMLPFSDVEKKFITLLEDIYESRTPNVQVNPNSSQSACVVLLQSSASTSSSLPSTSNALKQPSASTSARASTPASMPDHSIEFIDTEALSTHDDVAPSPGPIRHNRRRAILTQRAAREHMVAGNRTRIRLEQEKIRIMRDMLDTFKTYVAWSKYKQPQLRPKGLGLGADKVVTANQKKKQTNEKGEELSVVKNSYVKITAGKYSGYYGKVVSLDEDNGRVMVDIAVKKETVSLSEFMMQPVTKAEFDKESKVINAGSYEEYKKKELSKSSNSSPKPEKEASTSKAQDPNNRGHKDNENNKTRRDSPEDKRDRYRRDSSSSEERSRRRRKEQKKKRYSSNDSLDSMSDSDKKRKHKSGRNRYSSDSDSESPKDKRKRSPEKKRDIDKKRKGKKKKRDRDRSPHYKKYKK